MMTVPRDSASPAIMATGRSEADPCVRAEAGRFPVQLRWVFPRLAVISLQEAAEG
jgi:hypothetical protein